MIQIFVDSIQILIQLQIQTLRHHPWDMITQCDRNTSDITKKIQWKRNTHPRGMVDVVRLLGEAEYEKESNEKEKYELGTGPLSDSHVLMPDLVLHHL